MLALDFEVCPADIDETLLDGESPSGHVERLAREKASTVRARHSNALVLAGDTVVVLDGKILGKPSDAADAEAMLMVLAGRTHTVASGLALAVPDGRVLSGVSHTDVSFRRFSADTARRYVATGEPLDKAGSYGIQGFGATLVGDIRGDYYTVVGLPIPLLIRLLLEGGWEYGFGSLVPIGPGAS
ncbi:MAG: Maf family protein [Gemmatimonadota bacterium]|nr:MAG: Maf family protein [Gemmatimonadota bacterium]